MWDDYGHLTSQTAVGSGVVTYKYDAFGRRVTSQTPAQLTAGKKTYYIFDGQTLIGEFEGTGATAAINTTYTWGADGLVSERIAPPGGGFTSAGSLWYCYGPQGETKQLTNNVGTILSTYTYTSYGVPISSTGAYRNAFRYGGKAGYYSDVNGNAGVILCSARWYSTGLGRWLTMDPGGYGGGTNLYAYCIS